MQGANCSIAGCNTSRQHKGTSIFKIPKAKSGVPENMKWSENLINVVTRERVIDSDLKRQINEKRLLICEKHFKKKEIERCKLVFKLVVKGCDCHQSFFSEKFRKNQQYK